MEDACRRLAGGVLAYTLGPLGRVDPRSNAQISNSLIRGWRGTRLCDDRGRFPRLSRQLL